MFDHCCKRRFKQVRTKVLIRTGIEVNDRHGVWILLSTWSKIAKIRKYESRDDSQHSRAIVLVASIRIAMFELVNGLCWCQLRSWCWVHHCYSSAHVSQPDFLKTINHWSDHFQLVSPSSLYKDIVLWRQTPSAVAHLLMFDWWGEFSAGDTSDRAPYSVIYLLLINRSIGTFESEQTTTSICTISIFGKLWCHNHVWQRFLLRTVDTSPAMDGVRKVWTSDL